MFFEVDLAPSARSRLSSTHVEARNQTFAVTYAENDKLVSTCYGALGKHATSPLMSH